MNRRDLTATVGKYEPDRWSLAVFGGALDTGNLGVSALGTAVIEGAGRIAGGPRVTLFDNGWGFRDGALSAGSERYSYSLHGARLSRRLHRAESLHTMLAMASLRGRANSGLRIINGAAATLDVSGGDSFTDMYGMRRFQTVTMPKRIALKLRSPLILLPQTYGPFYGKEAKATARELLRSAHSAWARDQSSYEVLQDLIGSEFDETRHHCGVDMAFGLTPTKPKSDATDELLDWLSGGNRPVAGINVSGLLFGGPPPRTTLDPIKINYQSTMSTLINRLLTETEAKVLLVPHVITGGIGLESDANATAELMSGMSHDPDRVRVVPTDGLTANQAKWWIGQCDWFCGARMHSTIAALSSGVPTAALAYSIKTKPVFATANQEEHVVDAREVVSDADAVDRLWSSWLTRSDTAKQLATTAPKLRAQALEQMTQIMTSCQRLSEVAA